MSTKAKKTASAKPAAKAKAAPAPKAKVSGKAAKASAKEAPKADETAPVVDQDELDEAEDAAAAASSNAGGEAAALAAAGGSGEMSASFKNFRHHPDMENFYRFIFENDLRHEALAIIDKIMVEKQEKKASKGKSAH